MIQIDEAVVRQAFAALATAYQHHPNNEFGDALDALRRALEQPDHSEQHLKMVEQPAQQEPVALDEYDAGLLNDFGGGDVDWWQDYIRAELSRAYEHYQSQMQAPAHCEAGPEFCPQCQKETAPTYGSEEVRKLREVIGSQAKIIQTLEQPAQQKPCIACGAEQGHFDKCARVRWGIEQPAPVPEAHKQEPVIRYDTLHKYAQANGLDYNELCRITRSAYTRPQAREPEKEWVETACALIKAADDAAADGGYMLDSDDCIKVLRGEWKGPMANDHPPRPKAREWVGLTDDEIQTEWVLTPQSDYAEGLWFGRRIEAKLREKNT